MPMGFHRTNLDPMTSNLRHTHGRIIGTESPFTTAQPRYEPNTSSAHLDTLVTGYVYDQDVKLRSKANTQRSHWDEYKNTSAHCFMLGHPSTGRRPGARFHPQVLGPRGPNNRKTNKQNKTNKTKQTKQTNKTSKSTSGTCTCPRFTAKSRCCSCACCSRSSVFWRSLSLAASFSRSTAK